MSPGSPALVLIHGSWLGGWCWNEVASQLGATRRVLTPTLTGLGDRAHLASEAVNPALHVRDVLELLAIEEIDRVILVGHSYGSMVAHGLLDPLGDRVGGLVVLDGFLPEPGTSIFDARPDIQELLEPHRLADRPWLVAPPPAKHLGIDDPEAAGAAYRKLRPLPIGTHTTAINFSKVRLSQVRRSFIHLTRFGLLSAEADLAERQGWGRIDLDAFHFAMLSAPKMLADTIEAVCTP